MSDGGADGGVLPRTLWYAYVSTLTRWDCVFLDVVMYLQRICRLVVGRIASFLMVLLVCGYWCVYVDVSIIGHQVALLA